MKKWVYFLFTILVLSCQEPQESINMDKSEKIDSLEAALDSLVTVNLDLQDKLTSIKANENPKDLPFGEEFIKNKLKQSKELIEMESVLGGRMYFSNIQILNKKWILATYEDGHVQGVSIIQYNPAPDSNIKFKVLDSIENY